MKRILIGLIVAAVAFSSCKRTVDSAYGPSICPVDFQVVDQLTASVTTINFKPTSKSGERPTPYVKFTATMAGKDYTWKLKITGKTSKATRTFTGSSSIVEEYWYGEPDSAVFFTKEDCDVVLSVNCIDVASSTTVKITEVSSFSNLGWLPWNFETGSNPGGYGGTIRIDTVNASGTVSKSPQGGKFYNLSSVSASPVWYFAGVDIATIPNVGANKNKYIDSIGVLSSDPNEIYMNFYANMTGANPNSQIQVIIKEQVVGGSLVQRPIYFVNAADISGWKLISINLGKDFKVVDPTKLKYVGFNLGAYPTQATSAEMSIDFVIFTKGKPFSK